MTAQGLVKFINHCDQAHQMGDKELLEAVSAETLSPLSGTSRQSVLLTELLQRFAAIIGVDFDADGKEINYPSLSEINSELLNALQRMVKAFSPDLYRAAAAAHGRAREAEDAHLNAQAVLCRAMPHTGEDKCFCHTCAGTAPTSETVNQ